MATRFIRKGGRIIPISDGGGSARSKNKPSRFNKKAALAGAIGGAIGAAAYLGLRSKKTAQFSAQAASAAFWNQTPNADGSMNLYNLLRKHKP